MRVITLNQEKFRDLCSALASLVRDGETEGFDCAVSIRRGGAFVGNYMKSVLPTGFVGKWLEVELQRPSTVKKEGTPLGRLVHYLPTWTLDGLRICEAAWLRVNPKKKRQHFALPDGLISPAVQRVLVIDDAVDSGATLKAVVEGIRKVAAEARILTAVITVTTSNPLIKPDYSLFNDHTLVRFPWSMDSKCEVQSVKCKVQNAKC